MLLGMLVIKIVKILKENYPTSIWLSKIETQVELKMLLKIVSSEIQNNT